MATTKLAARTQLQLVQEEAAGKTMAEKRTLAMLAVASVFARTVMAVNKPIPQPQCNASQPVTVRYAESTARLYVEAAVEGERGGCVTLGQIFKAREGKAPLYAMDPVSGNRSVNATGTWLLTEELYVVDGITLNVRFCLMVDVW